MPELRLALRLGSWTFVNALKHFFVRYKAWIMALLAPLGGVWAVFIIGLIDAAIFGIPLDPVIIFYVATNPRRALLFCLMAALGSALGSTVPYLVGYKGGEALVIKKVGPERFARMHAQTEKYGDLALIIPCLMPPGFPFKLFVLMAGVTEMRYLHFLLSIFVGRLLRFVSLSLLIIAYGPKIVSFLGASFHQHRNLSLAVVAVSAAAFYLAVRYYNSRQRRNGPGPTASGEESAVA